MHLLQIQLNQQWDRHLMADNHPIRWDSSCRWDLEWWLEDQNLEQGQPLQLAVLTLFLYTDASNVGWGASLLQDSVSGPWDIQERSLHIVLELRTIRLGLLHFAEMLRDSVVAIFSDKNSREGGTHSTLLNKEAPEILDWAETHSVQILTQFVRSDNVVADCLNI